MSSHESSRAPKYKRLHNAVKRVEGIDFKNLDRNDVAKVVGAAAVVGSAFYAAAKIRRRVQNQHGNEVILGEGTHHDGGLLVTGVEMKGETSGDGLAIALPRGVGKAQAVVKVFQEGGPRTFLHAMFDRHTVHPFRGGEEAREYVDRVEQAASWLPPIAHNLENEAVKPKPDASPEV